MNALGCAVRIDTDQLSEGDAAEVERVWQDAVPRWDDPAPVDHLTVRVNTVIPLDYALSSLSQQVTLAAIEARRGQLWMLHAAGIADEAGRVIALVGPSGQGKTTSSRMLGAHYGYVSDETIGIAPDGSVVPYRKPLSVIEPGAPAKVQRPPSELGLRPLPEAPLRLAGLVLLDRRPDAADTAVVEECDLGEVLDELVAQTSYIADLPNPLRTIAAQLAAIGGIHRVTYREAETLPAALQLLFQEPNPVELAEPPVRARPSADLAGIYRGAYLDAVALDGPDRLALLQPDLPMGATFRLVAGIGPALWQAADGVPAADLEAAAVAAYGAPPGVDLRAAVAAAVAELTEHGVLAAEPTWRLRAIAVAGADGAEPVPTTFEGSTAAIWRVLAAARGIAFTRLVDLVAEQTGLPREQMETDVRTSLATLESAGLVERIAP